MIINRILTDLFIDSLGIGSYVILFHNRKIVDRENLLMISKIKITNIKINSWKIDDNLFLFAQNSKTGAPLIHSKAVIYRSGICLSEIPFLRLSDSKGKFNISCKSNIYQIENLKVSATDKDQYRVDYDYNDFYKRHFKLFRFYHFFKIPRKELLIITDRKIYRPGQTVYFKAILKKGDKRVVPDRSIILSLKDKNHRNIDTLELKTNKWGSVEGSFKIPISAVLGRYSIESKYDSEFFSVEEYKRPTFEVTVNNLEKEYALGDSVEITGFAKSFFRSSRCRSQCPLYR